MEYDILCVMAGLLVGGFVAWMLASARVTRSMAAEYRTVLPDEKALAAEIERTQAMLSTRKDSPQRHRGHRDGVE
jgi:hypothetical protein